MINCLLLTKSNSKSHKIRKSILNKLFKFKIVARKKVQDKFFY